MSFFSAITRAFTPPGTGYLEAQAEQNQAMALQAAKDAEEETKRAIKEAQLAAAGPLDSESARKAMESRWRQLLGMQGASWSFMNPPAGAPNASGTSMLMGG